MDPILLPSDFKEFLRLLNAQSVEYLLVGGYAVGHYGYPRYTGDINIWIARHQATAEKVTTVLKSFGFDSETLAPDLFLRERSIIRMGVPPVRIEITNYIDGVDFTDCYARRLSATIDDVPVSVISLDDLKVNKRAAGRSKDLDDLENLP